MLLCQVLEDDLVSCNVFVESSGTWSMQGTLHPWDVVDDERRAMVKAIREGRIATASPRFRDVVFGGTSVHRVEPTGR